MATDCGTVEATPTIESKAEEVVQFARTMKGDIEVFLRLPGSEKESKISVPTPMTNPINEILTKLDDARGLLGDIRGLIFGDVFSHIRR